MQTNQNSEAISHKLYKTIPWTKYGNSEDGRKFILYKVYPKFKYGFSTKRIECDLKDST